MSFDRLAWQREHRKKSGNVDTKKYEKTHKGFLMRLYRNMLSRISGVQYKKYHLYKNKELLNKEDFYSWALNSPEFYSLFKEYEGSNFDRKLAPSVDRKDSSRGYSIDNMEWVTTAENSLRGLRNRWQKQSQ